MRLFLYVPILFCLISIRAVAEEPSEIGKTVNRLVAKNLAPTFSEGDLPVFKDFDWQDQDEVLTAADELLLHIDEAWPYLIANIDNPAYSLTIRRSGGPEAGGNVTAGEISEHIIWRSIVVAYREFAPPDDDISRKMHRVGFVPFREFREWCKKQKDRKFVEIQIEGCQWAKTLIERCETLTEEERKKSLDALTQRIARLTKSGTSVTESMLFESGRKATFGPLPGTSAK